MNKGYYVYEPTNEDGSTRGRYGPYSLFFMRDFFSQLTKDVQKVEHCLALAHANPGVAVDMIETDTVQGIEFIKWCGRLYWFSE